VYLPMHVPNTNLNDKWAYCVHCRPSHSLLWFFCFPDELEKFIKLASNYHFACICCQCKLQLTYKGICSSLGYMGLLGTLGFNL